MKTLLTLFFLSAAVQAQTLTSGDWEYINENGDATIIKYKGSGGSVTIPSEINGLVVKKLGTTYAQPGQRNHSIMNHLVTNVTIPTSVITIGNEAFGNCYTLPNITIPDSVTSIGNDAFSNCYGATNITIGRGVTALGTNIFSNCYGTEGITFLGNAPYYAGNVFGGFGGVVYYDPSTLGWNSTYAGRPTVPIGSFRLTTTFNSQQGSVTNSPSGVIFAPMTEVQLNATPNTGYAFTAWSGDVTSTNPSVLVIMNTNKSETASFGPDATDSDGDGLSNYQEAIVFNTNPNHAETNSPVAGLYLASEKQAERAAGQNDVINNPLQYGLFSDAQIELGMFGGVFLSRTNNQFVLQYHILRSSDLQSWTPFQTNSVVIPVENTNKMFFQLMPVMTSPAPGLPTPI